MPRDQHYAAALAEWEIRKRQIDAQEAQQARQQPPPVPQTDQAPAHSQGDHLDVQQSGDPQRLPKSHLLTRQAVRVARESPGAANRPALLNRLWEYVDSADEHRTIPATERSPKALVDLYILERRREPEADQLSWEMLKEYITYLGEFAEFATFHQCHDVGQIDATLLDQYRGLQPRRIQEGRKVGKRPERQAHKALNQLKTWLRWRHEHPNPCFDTLPRNFRSFAKITLPPPAPSSTLQVKCGETSARAFAARG